MRRHTRRSRRPFGPWNFGTVCTLLGISLHPSADLTLSFRCENTCSGVQNFLGTGSTYRDRVHGIAFVSRYASEETRGQAYMWVFRRHATSLGIPIPRFSDDVKQCSVKG